MLLIHNIQDITIKGKEKKFYNTSSSTRLFLELVLSDTLTHSSGTADTTADHLQHVVNIVGTAPLLVSDDVHAELHLGLLDQLAVGAHALVREGAGELVRDEGGGVQARQGDELPAVTQGAQTLDVGLLLVAGHGLLPVEGGGEVVGEPRYFVRDVLV